MKISTRFSLYCALFASSVSLVSCTLSDDFDKLSSIQSIEATGSFNANILNETWLLKDLLPTQKLNLTEGADGSYSFGYDNSSNFILDKVKFPLTSSDPKSLPLYPLNASNDYNNTPTGQYFAAPAIAIDFEIQKPEMGDTPFADDFKIKAVKLRDGAQIVIAMDVSSNSDTQISVVIPSLTKNGIPYSKTFAPIVGSAQTNLMINDLDGYIVATDPKIIAIIQPKIKRISNPIDGEIKATLTMDISDHQEYIQGFFGETNLSVGTIDFPFSMPEDFKGVENSQMTLKEITITLKATQNGFGVPLALDLSKGNLIYYKGNSDPKPIEIIPVSMSEDGKTFKFKIQNVNVLNVEKFVLNPVITANKGLTSGDNMITDTASIDYDISANLPLDVDAENLAFEQEGDNLFYNDPTDVSGSDFEFVDGKVILKGAISSQIPMGASLQVYYKDNSDDDTYLDTLFDQPISISANGTSNFLASVTKEKLDALKKYKYQVMKVTLNGSGAITSSQKINLKLGVAAKGTVKTKI